MNPDMRGKLGEVAVVGAFLKDGYDVYTSPFGSQGCDMVIVKGDEVKRVEVKTTSNVTKSGKYAVYLVSTKGTATGQKRTKFDGSKSDLLVVFVEPTGRIHMLDSKVYDGRRGVTVEG